MDGWAAVEALATEHHGYVRRREAVELGLAPETLRRTARDRGWERPHRGVISLPGLQPTPERRLAAAVVRIGAPVQVAAWSAAWLWGLVPALPSEVELLVPHGRRAARADRVRVHRTRNLGELDVATVRGLPSTSLARTLCDLAGRLQLAALRNLVIDARQRRLVTLVELGLTLDRLGPIPGAGRLRQVITELGGDGSDSPLEFGLRRRFVAVDMRPDDGQAAVVTPHRTVHIDIPWSRQQVGVEPYGFGSHSERWHLEVDSSRHNGVILTDWLVFRATWRHLEDDAAFAELAADVRAALIQRGG